MESHACHPAKMASREEADAESISLRLKLQGEK